MTSTIRRAWPTLGAALLLAVAALGSVSLPSQDNRPGPAAVAMPRVLVSYEFGIVQVSGTVPDEAERAAIEQRVRTLYVGVPLYSHLQVGAVGNPSWLSATYLPDLRGASRARATLADAELLIEAEVPSAAQRDQLLAAAAAAASGVGLRVRSRIELLDSDAPRR